MSIEFLLEAKQKQYILGLAEADANPMIMLVWITITQLIMTLHWRLFKRGRWFSHMEDLDERDKRVACFEFCRGPCQNPVAFILNALGSIMFDPDYAGWESLRLLHFRYGNSSAEWPPDVLTELHRSVVTAWARLWRLIYVFFRVYPWLLVAIFDPESSPETVTACLDAFLALPEDSPTLDPGLGRPLRKLVHSRADLLENKALYHMLSTLYYRVVMTSTFVERVFRDLTGWTSSRMNQNIASVAARYTNQTFASTVGRWRKHMGYAACDPPGMQFISTITIRPYLLET